MPAFLAMVRFRFWDQAGIGALFQSWQAINRLTRFLLRQTEVVEALQVQPRLRDRAEELREAKRRVAGD